MDSFLRKTPSLVTLSPFFPPDFFPSKAEAETSFPQGLHFILPNPRDRVSVNNLDRNPFLGSRPVFHGFSFRAGLFKTLEKK